MTKNDKTNTALITAMTFSIGLLLMIPIIMDANATPGSCGIGHTDNGDGTCTFGYASGTVYDIRNNGGTATTTCDGSSYTITTANPRNYARDSASSSNPVCARVGYEFDTSSIPISSNITDVDAQIVTTSVSNARVCDVYEANLQPSTISGANAWTDAGNGTVYLDADSFCTASAETQTIDLGSSADVDLENLLSQGWFAFYSKLDSETRDGSFHQTSITSAVLQVTYTPPTQEQQDIAELQSQIIKIQNQLMSLNATTQQHDLRITALETNMFPVYYVNQGTEKIIPASSESQFATVSCNAEDTAISGSWNINGLTVGVNGIQITNSVQTADGNGWYLRINNAAGAEAQFTPAVLCVHYLG